MAGKVTDFNSLASPADDDALYIVQVSDSTDKKITFDNFKSNVADDFISATDYPSDSSWTEVTSLDNGWTGSVAYIKRAGMVTITLDLDGSSATSNVVLSTPSGYVPAVNCFGACVGLTATDVPLSFVSSSAGQLAVNGDGRTNSAVKGGVTYPVL